MFEFDPPAFSTTRAADLGQSFDSFIHLFSKTDLLCKEKIFPARPEEVNHNAAVDAPMFFATGEGLI